MDEPERRILSLDQTEALLDAARKIGGVQRWAYFAMACLSGLRREEILRLSPDQVNLSEGPGLVLHSIYIKRARKILDQQYPQNG